MVDQQLVAAQIDRRAVERPRQLLDARVPKDAFEHRLHLPALDEGVSRQGVVVDRVAPDPLLVATGVDLAGIAPARQLSTDEGAHAHAADPVDHHPRAQQHVEHAEARRIALIVGGASGIGRETALLAASRGAHVVVADLSLEAAQKVADECKAIGGKECAVATVIDIRKRDAIKSALDATIAAFGGLDLLINTAAIFPSSPDGTISDAQWGLTLEINVTSNYLLTDEASKVFTAQSIPGSIVLTSSANAVVPKRGTEAYDVSKAALSHLVRELAVTYSPLLRVNGISPATVVKGSTMFPRDRVKASLAKYAIAFDEAASDDDLRFLLATFYAKRTLTHVPIDPKDCAEAILFIGGPRAPRHHRPSDPRRRWPHRGLPPLSFMLSFPKGICVCLCSCLFSSASSAGFSFAPFA